MLVFFEQEGKWGRFVSILTKRGGANYDYCQDKVVGVSVQNRVGIMCLLNFLPPNMT
jgi:hypothetical protein